VFGNTVYSGIAVVAVFMLGWCAATSPGVGRSALRHPPISAPGVRFAEVAIALLAPASLRSCLTSSISPWCPPTRATPAAWYVLSTPPISSSEPSLRPAHPNDDRDGGTLTLLIRHLTRKDFEMARAERR